MLSEARLHLGPYALVMPAHTFHTSDTLHRKFSSLGGVARGCNKIIAFENVYGVVRVGMHQRRLRCWGHSAHMTAALEGER